MTHIISNRIRDVVNVLSKHWLSLFIGNNLKKTLAQKISENLRGVHLINIVFSSFATFQALPFIDYGGQRRIKHRIMISIMTSVEVVTIVNHS